MRLITTFAAALLAAAVVACGAPSAPPPMLTQGDRDRGRMALIDRGCVACHDIPGIPQAEPRSVGPSLDGLVDQAFIAGVLENDPENLVLWIMHPEAVDPNTAMPDLGVTRDEAQDMVAYLYGR